MQRVDVTADLPVPPEEAFRLLSVHENLGPCVGGTVRSLRPGRDGTAYGEGSVRGLHVGGLPEFEETVTAVQPGRSLSYRITRGSVLRRHSGRIDVTSHGSGSRVRWVVDFTGVVPGIGPVVARRLRRSIPAGLRSLAGQER